LSLALGQKPGADGNYFLPAIDEANCGSSLHQCVKFLKKVRATAYGSFNFFADFRIKGHFCTCALFGPHRAFGPVCSHAEGSWPLADMDKITVADWGRL